MTMIGTITNADASGRLLVMFDYTTLPMNWCWGDQRRA